MKNIAKLAGISMAFMLLASTPVAAMEQARAKEKDQLKSFLIYAAASGDKQALLAIMKKQSEQSNYTEEILAEMLIDKYAMNEKAFVPAAAKSPAPASRPAIAAEAQKIVAVSGGFTMGMRVSKESFYFINNNPAMKDILDKLSKKIGKKIDVASNKDALRTADKVIVFWILDGRISDNTAQALLPLEMAEAARTKIVIGIKYGFNREEAQEEIKNLPEALKEMPHFTPVIAKHGNGLFDVLHNDQRIDRVAEALAK